MSRAIAAIELTATRTVGYPEPFKSRIDRTKRKLGEAFGLSQFGVNLVELGAGGQSALRHWHTHEDELVYILAGELVLITDAGEQVVHAGDVVGFPGGNRDAHHLVNRSTAPARYLEVGSRIEVDDAHYPDDDLKWVGDAAAHKDGTPY